MNQAIAAERTETSSKADSGISGPRLRLINRLCFTIIVAIVSLNAWWPRLAEDPAHWPSSANMGDFSLNVRLSDQVCGDLKYPTAFAYPPPAVLFWHGLGRLGIPAAGALWLLLVPTSVMGSFLFSRLLGRARDRDGDSRDGMVMVFAFVVTSYFVMCDVVIGNCNSVYLLLVLLALWCWQKQKYSWAGIFLAASVALKIYSIAFLPLLLLRKMWRIGSVMAAAVLFLFLALPSLYFGWHNTVVVTQHWLEAMRSASRLDYLLGYHACKISLAWCALVLLNGAASAGKVNQLDLNMNSVALIVRLVQLGWLLAVALYFVVVSPLQTQTRRGRLAFALDCSVILLLPLPLSPFLQPHHLVVLVLPAVVLAGVASDSNASRRSRALAIFTVATSACLTRFADYPCPGIGAMLTVAIYFVGICIIRWDKTAVK